MINEKDFHYNKTPFGVIITEYIGHDTKVNIPKEIDGTKVTLIGECAFAADETVKEIIVPKGVRIIGHYAFSECKNLVKITLPESIRIIFSDVFDECYSLKKIAFNGTEEQWKKVIKDRKLKNISISFNSPKKLTQFLNECLDADEIRKEEK